jgi:hypothetical protein
MSEQESSLSRLYWCDATLTSTQLICDFLIDAARIIVMRDAT